MCTAITFKTSDNYFGRTLDLEYSYNEKVIITPRNYKLSYKYTLPYNNNYSIIGVGIIENGYPLYYDAINEKGLSIAGLNFPKSCVYNDIDNSKLNITSYELIPWILRNFKTVNELKPVLTRLNITNDCFNKIYNATPLHWLISDKVSSVVLEQTELGLKIIDNEIGVLTNEPDFIAQLDNLTKYANLSPNEPKTFTPPSSRGLGAFGLPGDVSSSSRFVRATFNKQNSICDGDEASSINQFLIILGSVKQINGCVRLDDNKLEKTIYTNCYNQDKTILYYTTYNNPTITMIELYNENLDGCDLVIYNMQTETNIICQN